MQTPFQYKDDIDRLQAGAERNKTLTWLDGHVSEIINVHDKLKHRQGLSTADLNLLDIVLNTVVCNIFHDRAECAVFGLEHDGERKSD